MTGLLTIYSDYACPYCFLAERPLSALRTDGIECAYRAFELRPAPVPLYDSTTWARLGQQWPSSILPLARRLGVDIRFPSRPIRTRKAHEAAAFARARGRFDAMHAAMFDAYFQDDADIGRIDVLVAIGESVGFDRSELKVALDIDQYTDEVLEQQRIAAQEGIVAVPTFVKADGDAMAGVHPYEALRTFVLE